MAYNDDVIVGIEFLMGAARYVSHWNQLRVDDLGELEFPGLSDVEQRKLTALVFQNFYFFR